MRGGSRHARCQRWVYLCHIILVLQVGVAGRIHLCAAYGVAAKTSLCRVLGNRLRRIGVVGYLLGLLQSRGGMDLSLCKTRLTIDNFFRLCYHVLRRT